MERKLLLLMLLLSCFSGAFAAPNDGSASTGSTDICMEFLGRDCDAEQRRLLQEYVGNIDIQSLSNKLQQDFAGAPRAFTALPKDHAGFVNWNKSVTDGIIRPLGTLNGKPEEENEGYFANMMVFNTKVPEIPNVLFPHGMHTYWLSCESCHPKPFKKKRGSNDFTMGDIIRGEFCGKCHGKVSFPPGTFKNCNRCHILRKEGKTPFWGDTPK
ncbi:MAG: hypothetical protein L3J28_04185 [Candidatus Polarisedimenticolaceae bacterium]|nr:hypothetical protein [Candidatus Polarisedimenticolaceae bacterium]